MILSFIFLTCLTSVISYNLDYDYPLIYSDSSNRNANNRGSYFGFSVLLIPEWDTLEPTLIVGAPKANHSGPRKSVKEPGVIYQCPLFATCRLISSTLDSPPDIAIKIGMYAKVIQDNGWFGMSISALHPTLLKICAPHTKVNLFKPFTNDYIETMQGMCYFYFDSNDTTFLQIETESLTTYNFSSHHWYNPIHGFSQNVAQGIPSNIKLNGIEKSESVIRSLLENTSTIAGNPSGSISLVQANKRKTLVVSNYQHEQAEFGYSVTSGKFFSKNEILFAGGAPVWKLFGKVAIINSSTYEPTVVQYLYGNDLGEYFGASLTSGDMNNDGLDDLIVGAPHFGDDFGKIYIYLGSEDGFPENDPTVVIEGHVSGAQFGYSVTSGDIDGDGFNDLIVGAPWEESGVIYIYNGFSVLGEDNNLPISQRIAATDLSKNLRGFGFSVSNLIDMDKNGFADLAIGAYKSGHAVILRAKPVEKSQIDLKVQPTVVKKGTTRISPEFCMKNYKNTNPEVIKNYTVKIVIDSKHKRFMYEDIVWHIPITEKTYQVFQYRFSRQSKMSRLTNPHWNGCTTSHFSMKPEIHNMVDPVDIVLTYEFNTYRITKNESNDNFCKFCPVRYKGRESKTIKLLVPFETDCGKDQVCNSDISVTTSMFGVVGENNTWEVGSGDISIEAKFQNHGEPAYLVVADFHIPKIIHLRSILSLCQETILDDLLVVTCNVGNPLNKQAQKTIRLDLDMRHFEIHNLTDIESHKMFINMTIKSYTNNQGVKRISMPLTFKNNASTYTTGKTVEDSYYLIEHQWENENITFQHIYNVYKNGPTQISEGKLIINVPTSFDNNEPFIFIAKPQLQASGVLYNCVSNNIPVLSSPTTELESTVDKYKLQNVYKIEKRSSPFTNKDIEKEFTETHLSDSVRNTEKNINNTFLMNCSNNRVQCGTVTCDLAALKTPQGIGIALTFSLRVKALENILPIGSILEYATRVQTKVLKPLENVSETLVVTKFYNIKNTKVKSPVNVWIVITSVVIGLVILLGISRILHHVGFFRKKPRKSYGFLNINEREHDQYFLEFQQQDDYSQNSDESASDSR